jgi:hypothetical protein
MDRETRGANRSDAVESPKGQHQVRDFGIIQKEQRADRCLGDNSASQQFS